MSIPIESRDIRKVISHVCELLAEKHEYTIDEAKRKEIESILEIEIDEATWTEIEFILEKARCPIVIKIE